MNNNCLCTTRNSTQTYIKPLTERTGKRRPTSVWTDGSRGCAPANKLSLQGNSTPIEKTTYTTGTIDTQRPVLHPPSRRATLLSQPMGPGRHGSQGWTVCWLRELGRRAMQTSPSLDLEGLVLWACHLNLLIHAGPPPATLSLLSPTNAGRLCAERALQSHPVSMSARASASQSQPSPLHSIQLPETWASA